MTSQEISILVPDPTKRERASGNLFWKTFSLNFFDKKVFLARTKYVLLVSKNNRKIGCR